MANTLRIKRRASGGSSGAPSSLENAELAFNESDAGNGVLYYGYGTGGAGGSATNVVAIGGDGAFVNLSGNQTISGNKTFTGTVDLSGATVSGNTTFGNNLTVTGNLVVNGTTTTVNSTSVSVDDKNIELASTASPSDASADGGGLTIKGTTDKTWSWIDASDSWTSSEHVDLASGKSYKINGTNVLSGSSLGSGVTGSSLTSVGTLTSGTWNATTIAVARGGTGATSASGARTNLGVAIGSDVQAFDADLTNLSGMQSGASAALALLTSAEVAVLDGATVTTAELNKLDGATVTTAEINIVDGSTSATSTTLAAADRLVVNDGGTMVQVALSDLVTFLENGSVSSFDVDGGTF